MKTKEPIITYRKATSADIPALTNMRMELLSSANQKSRSELKDAEAGIYEYYQKNLSNGMHIAYVAEQDGTLAGTGGMCYYKVLPTYHNPSGKRAYIINIYTVPKMRGQGIAGHILDMLVKEALQSGFKYISLEATSQGQRLYQKHGFTFLPAEMQLQNETFDAMQSEKP